MKSDTNETQELTTSPKGKRREPLNIPLEAITHYADRGLTHQEIADLLGCDRSNITSRLQRAGYERQRVDAYKKYRADAIANMQRRLLESITEEDIKKSSMYQRLGSFGLLYDKEGLERNKSTQILSTTQQIDQINAILSNIKELADMLGVKDMTTIIDIPSAPEGGTNNSEKSGS